MSTITSVRSDLATRSVTIGYDDGTATERIVERVSRDRVTISGSSISWATLRAAARTSESEGGRLAYGALLEIAVAMETARVDRLPALAPDHATLARAKHYRGAISAASDWLTGSQDPSAQERAAEAFDASGAADAGLSISHLAHALRRVREASAV